ncbi:hypothetical protein KC19_5G193100 [Ceratodon purpureus]|uniref:Ureidoglycolate hydrolase n=1 Tax=Ceratodon purpureus TaxID=3225 RepID=A0A8T0I392_CERPU|nr:hypothetical protein KC19_5G193100 [Ceratodon purpureus]
MAGPQICDEAAEAPSPPLRTVMLPVTDLTPDSFAPFGQVVDPQLDGGRFGPHDAQLDLTRGTPRFYLMRLQNRTLQFDRITHHAKTTQCLGSVNSLPWYLGVAQPTILGATETVDLQKRPEVLKGDGYDYLPPAVENIRLFKVEGPRFLKLHAGTWHAGPLFEEPWMDFYNLELSNTNETDHTTYNFKKNKDMVFEVENPCSC